MPLDTSWFLSVYGLSHHSAMLDWMGVFFASYLPYSWVGVFMFASLWPYERRARNRIIVMVSIIAGAIAFFGVKSLILLVYLRSRPFMSLPNIHPLIHIFSWDDSHSFPSGHASFFFALAAVLFCFNRKVGIIALIAASLIGVARVYAGVHWPSDIFAGAGLGILTGLITYFCYVRYANIVHRSL